MWWNLVIWSPWPPRSVLYLLFQSPRSHSSLLNPLLCWSVIPMIKIGPKIPSLAVGLCPCPRVLDNTRCIRGRVSVSNVAMSQLATTIARVIFHGQTADDSAELKWIIPFAKLYRQKIVLTFVPDWDIPLFVQQQQQQAPDGCRVPPRERESITGYFYILTKMTAAALTINWADTGLASGPHPRAPGRGARGKQQSCGVRQSIFW